MDAIEAAFAAGHGKYGYLHFSSDEFASHLKAISNRSGRSKCFNRGQAQQADAHLTDLYLTLGCARRSARAWRLFSAEFYDYIARLAVAATKCSDDGAELTECVVVSLYMPTRLGQCRIGLYDGRCALATWLRVLVSRRAITEHRRKRSQSNCLETLSEHPDESAHVKIDSELRASRYGSAVQSALYKACERLSPRERTLLLLRFGAATKQQDIASRLSVHPSNVSREIKKICARLRTDVIRVLDTEYRLTGSAIEECLADILENPAYSVLTLLEPGAGGTLEPGL